MKEIRKIVGSNTEPSNKEVLWLDTAAAFPGIFKIYTKRGRWEPIGISKSSTADLTEIQNKIDELEANSVSSEYVDKEVQKIQNILNQSSITGNVSLNEDVSGDNITINSNGALLQGPVTLNFPTSGSYMVVVNTDEAANGNMVSVGSNNMPIADNKLVFSESGDKVVMDFKEPTQVNSINFVQKYEHPKNVSAFINDAGYITMGDLCDSLNAEYLEPNEALVLKRTIHND